MSVDGSSSAVCVVWEPGGSWGAHLKQGLRGTGVVLKQCASLTECWRQLEQYPQSILLLVVAGADLEPVFEMLCRMGRRFSGARVVVALPRGYERQGWWLREAGATHVIHSSRELSSAAQLVRRHLAQAPAIEMTWAQRILASLPWSD